MPLRALLRWAVPGLLLAGVLFGVATANRALLFISPDDLPRHRGLAAFASVEAWPNYLLRCASCHGWNGRGRAGTGAPNLLDNKWLYGTGEVWEIERSILFGIRSGDPRARNVTDMPAFLYEKRLTRREIAQVTEYVLALGRRPHDIRAAVAGRSIYISKGVCYDCHGVNGTGQPDFGAPSFTAMDLIHGTDRASIRQSISVGRHGICPSWHTVLGAAQIRAMALGLHDGKL